MKRMISVLMIMLMLISSVGALSGCMGCNDESVDYTAMYGDDGVIEEKPDTESSDADTSHSNTTAENTSDYEKEVDTQSETTDAVDNKSESGNSASDNSGNSSNSGSNSSNNKGASSGGNNNTSSNNSASSGGNKGNISSGSSTSKKSYTMVDYYGMTINDVAAIWGSDYSLENGLYKGGWKGVYYADKRTPLIFYFAVSNPANQECTGYESVVAVEYWLGDAQGKPEHVYGGVRTDYTYSKLSGITSGELNYMAIDDNYWYSYDYNSEVVVIYVWSDSAGTALQHVTVDFSQ